MERQLRKLLAPFFAGANAIIRMLAWLPILVASARNAKVQRLAFDAYQLGMTFWGARAELSQRRYEGPHIDHSLCNRAPRWILQNQKPSLAGTAAIVCNLAFGAKGGALSGVAACRLCDTFAGKLTRCGANARKARGRRVEGTLQPILLSTERSNPPSG